MEIKTKIFKTVNRESVAYGLKSTFYELTLFHTDFGLEPGGTYVFFDRYDGRIDRALDGENVAYASSLQELYDFVVQHGGEQTFKEYLSTLDDSLNTSRMKYWLAPDRTALNELNDLFDDDDEVSVFDYRLCAQPLIVSYLSYFEKVSIRAALPTAKKSNKQTSKI